MVGEAPAIWAVSPFRRNVMSIVENTRRGTNVWPYIPQLRCDVEAGQACSDDQVRKLRWSMASKSVAAAA